MMNAIFTDSSRQAHESLYRAEARAAASRVRYPVPALTDKCRAVWEVEIRDTVIKLPGLTEDGEERFQTVLVINLVNDYGERFTFHKDFFAIDVAERFAARTRAALAEGATPRGNEKWTEGNAVYGSLYYEHSNGEGKCLAWELSQDGMI